MLLDVEHTVRAFPAATLTVEDARLSIGIQGSFQKDARLELRFARCLDLSQVGSLSFRMTGSGGDVDVALDSPTNMPPPEGDCIGMYCYSPVSHEFLESPSVQAQASWSDFMNGAPSANGDPAHVLGITWSVKGEPGDRIDLHISELVATTLW